MLLSSEQDVIQDITEFLLETENCHLYDTITLYNKWTTQNSVLLSNRSFVNVALEYLNNAKTTDKTILLESYSLDKKNNIFH